MRKIKKILVVDDEPVIQIDLSQQLTDLGYTVVGHASDGFDAVERCQEHYPDIVLMDIKMPIFDGFGATETILQRGLSSCVVMLTAYYSADYIERAKQVGASGYLLKPIDYRTLHATLEVAYAQSKRLQQSHTDTLELRRKIEEMRLTERAKVLVARERGITEGEAYRELQRLSMNKRCSLRSIAEVVVQRNSQRETVNRAKQYLITMESMSEQDAYRHLTALAKHHGITLFQAAQRILAQTRPLR